MSQTSLILDIFKFFARFPDQPGVMELFNKGRSDIEGYANLFQQIKDIPVHSLIPEIKHYVFGVNEEAVKKRISNIHSFFMLVDFGEINSDVDDKNRIRDSLVTALTIAFPFSDMSGDLIEQTLVFDHTLELLLKIRRIMIREQKERYWLKDLSENHSLVPWVSKTMSSIGWSMIFDRQGFDMLEGRTL